MMAALAKDPLIHVYHYAPYEPSALKRLMGRHGTREDELDQLLHEKILVDLTRSRVQSLADLKAGVLDQADRGVLHGRARAGGHRRGDSIVRFEEWLDTGDQALLDAIEAYNEVDCLSTVELHRWLLERRR